MDETEAQRNDLIQQLVAHVERQSALQDAVERKTLPVEARVSRENELASEGCRLRQKVFLLLAKAPGPDAFALRMCEAVTTASSTRLIKPSYAAGTVRDVNALYRAALLVRDG